MMGKQHEKLFWMNNLGLGRTLRGLTWVGISGLMILACEPSDDVTRVDLAAGVSADHGTLENALAFELPPDAQLYCESGFHAGVCVSPMQLLLTAAQACSKSGKTLAQWNMGEPCTGGFTSIDFLCCAGETTCCLSNNSVEPVSVKQCQRPLPPLLCDPILPVCCAMAAGPTWVPASQCSPKAILEHDFCQPACVPKGSVDSCQSPDIWKYWADKQCGELGRTVGELTLGPACEKGKYLGAKALCCGWKEVCCKAADGALPQVVPFDLCPEDQVVSWDACAAQTAKICLPEEGCCPALTAPFVAGSADVSCPKAAPTNHYWQCWGTKSQCTDWGYGVAQEHCDPDTAPDCPSTGLLEGYIWRCWPDGTIKCTTKETGIAVANGACIDQTKPTCPTTTKKFGKPPLEWGCWEGEPICLSYGYLVSPEVCVDLVPPVCSDAAVEKTPGYTWQCWPDGTLHCTFWGTGIGSTLPCRDLPKPNCGGTKKEGPNYKWQCWPDGSLKCTNWGTAVGSTLPCKELPKPTCPTTKKGDEPNYAWQCWGTTAQCTNWGYGVASGACANLPKPDCGQPKATDAPNYKWECWGNTAQCTNWGTGVSSGHCSDLAKPVCQTITKKVTGANLAWQCWGQIPQCTNWGIAVGAAQCDGLVKPECSKTGEPGKLVYDWMCLKGEAVCVGPDGAFADPTLCPVLNTPSCGIP